MIIKIKGIPIQVSSELGEKFREYVAGFKDEACKIFSDKQSCSDCKIAFLEDKIGKCSAWHRIDVQIIESTKKQKRLFR